MKNIAAMGAFALATLVAPARDITSLTLAQSGDDLTANVVFTAGETGDGHTLYLAYGPSDLGNTLYAWANGGAYINCGTVGDDATSATVALAGAAKTAACYRAFLVKSTGVTPAYTTKLIDCIREDNGNAWFATDYFCSSNEAITVVFDGMNANNKRLFGSRSPDYSSVFEVYHGGDGWHYAYLTESNRTKYNFSTKTVDDYDGKAELTFDTKNRILRRTGADGTVSQANLSNATRLFLVGVDKSPYPLCIFGAANSVDGSSIVGNYAAANALLYRFHIRTNDAAFAHYYIPSVSTVNAGKGCLWDAVENKIVESSKQDSYVRSYFLTKDASDSEYPELDFHAAVPAELQTKYETISSTFAAVHPAREITNLTIGKDKATGTVTATAAFTYGASCGRDILYIAWDAEDKGETLAAWGENVYCAGEVADDATGATVTLPAGKYPLVFRAFLITPGALDCDSFAEYLLSDGTSYIKTDWLHTNGDNYSIKFSVEEIATGSRLFGNSYSKGKSFVEIYQWTNNAGVAYYRLSTDGPSEQNWYSTLTTRLPAELGLTLLAYDSGTGLLKVQYSDETSYQYTFTPGSSAETLEGNAPVWLFASRRTQGNQMPSGSKFYSMTISTNSVADAGEKLSARHFVPAVKDGAYGVWDAVQNKFIAPSAAFLAPTNGLGEVCAPVPFSAVSVPEELRRKWFDSTVVSDVAYLPPAGITLLFR